MRVLLRRVVLPMARSLDVVFLGTDLICFPGVKYSQQILCDTMSSARGSGGERVGRLVVSPVQLEPSHTLLETHNHKPVRECEMVPVHISLCVCCCHDDHVVLLS